MRDLSLFLLGVPVSEHSIPPGLARSPVFERELRGRVTHPNSGWTLALGIGGAILLGLATFAALEASRPRVAKPASSVTAPIHRPAPRTETASAVFHPAMPPLVSPTQTTPVVDTLTRLRAPAVVVDLSEPSAAAGAPAASVAGAADDKLSPDERFALRMRGVPVETSQATHLKNVSEVVTQGTVIPAVLETAIDSDLPGSVRAVVSRDVRGFDGTRVLIPRGSKLVGEYRSGVSLGHSRAFVIWSRILTPDGISIEVGSPGTDPLGRGGLSGETDTHFFTRFGGAILLSVMSAGTELAAAQGNGTSVVIGAAPAQPTTDILQKQVDIPVTVKVLQGTPLQVFVARDLDFATTTPP